MEFWAPDLSKKKGVCVREEAVAHELQERCQGGAGTSASVNGPRAHAQQGTGLEPRQVLLREHRLDLWEETCTSGSGVMQMIDASTAREIWSGWGLHGSCSDTWQVVSSIQRWVLSADVRMGAGWLRREDKRWAGQR